MVIITIPKCSVGQTVVWQLEPSNYEDITCIGNNLYKIVLNGKVGLIHSNGVMVVEPKTDGLGLFYEGKALLTATDSHGERIVGCLTENGDFHKFVNKYYTLNGQKFYSDQLLSVANENGKVGYIDSHGNEVVGFDGKYNRIKPFVEGYAVVQKNKKYYLIDKEGESVRFTFDSVGEVFGCTNAYNGIVYVWDADGRFYTYDINNGGNCKSVRKPKSTSFDYLYRFTSVSGKSKQVPFENKKYKGINGLAPSFKDGVYGYKSNNKMVLPYQLGMASSFENNYAVVRLNGKLGILKYISDSSFEINQGNEKIKFYTGDKVKCSFNIIVPKIWRDKNIDIDVVDLNGKSLSIQKEEDGIYTFIVNPKSTTNENYVLKVRSEGLLLHENMISFSFIQKYKCPVCGVDTEKCPYRGKHPKKEKEKNCPVCGKKISECKYNGVHY